MTPAAAFTCTCLTPSSSYSTGSSIVISVLSGVLISLRAAYRVVVLPAPVGPVTSTAPWSCLIKRSRRARSAGSIPSRSRSVTTRCLSRIRITTDSPRTRGSVATRMST